jgi:hypothetical protein
MVEPQLFPEGVSPEEHVAKHQNKDEPMQPLNTKINDIATRLKILEERYMTLRKKAELGEQNVVESQKEHFEELHTLKESVMDIKHTLRDVTEKVSLLSEEISHFATKNDLVVLQRYVEFWEPMDFVTRKEINDFLRKKFGKKKRTEETATVA